METKNLFKKISGTVIYILIIIAVVFLVPKISSVILKTSYPIAAISSSSMWPSLKAGDLILIKGIEKKDLEINDIVVYKDANQSLKDLATTGFDASSLGFNGDDALGLFKDDVLIDLFGVFEVDPGSSWVVGTGSTADCVLIRDPSIVGPNATWDTSEWVVGTDQDYTNLGLHTVTPS